MSNAVIYARYSPRPDDGAESIRLQIEKCREYAAKHGHTVVAVFEDAEKSGADFDRPGLWDAMHTLKKGMVLLVWKFDRLCRDAYLGHILEKDACKRNASIISVSGEGKIDQNMSPNDRLIIGILRLFSEHERLIIAQRTRIAMRRHQRLGRRMSDHTPFGTMRDPADPSRLIQNPTEIEAMRLAILMQAQGKGLRAIVKTLNARGYTNRLGKPLDHRSLWRSLDRIKRDDDLAGVYRKPPEKQAPGTV